MLYRKYRVIYIMTAQRTYSIMSYPVIYLIVIVFAKNYMNRYGKIINLIMNSIGRVEIYVIL